MAAEAFPLYWPEGWPRAKHRARSLFKRSFTRARNDLFHELRLLGATHIVLSTNIPIRNDGLPYAREVRIEDPGVAIYFTLRERSLSMARDAHPTVHENLAALAESISHIRGLERHGGAQMVDRAFMGFAALPSPDDRSWPRLLGLKPDATLAEIEEAYRRLASTNHPDRGGQHDRMAEINRAIAAARAARAPRAEESA